MIARGLSALRSAGGSESPSHAPSVRFARRGVEHGINEPPPSQAPECDEVEESATNRKPSSPEIVTRAVADALFSEKPKLRYLVGTKWEGDRVIHALIERLLDENDNPQHDYSQAELEAMLAEHIRERRGG